MSSGVYLRDVTFPCPPDLEFEQANKIAGFATPRGLAPMKNPVEVLHIKELELTKVKKEIDALRIAIRLLADETQCADQKADLRPVVEMP